MIWNQLLCPHAGPSQDDSVRPCYHPHLTGLNRVTPDQCARCHYRDQSSPRLAIDASVLRGWDCGHLQALPDDDGNLEETRSCDHPSHGETTRRRCATCPDYLFPHLSPRMTVDMAARVLRLGSRRHPDAWWTWPNVQAAFRLLLDEVTADVEPAGENFAGRGIVIVGGGKYFPSTYVTLSVLRHIGCTLPVELWHLDGELSRREQNLLNRRGCRCINGQAHGRANGFPWHDSWWKGWQLKAYAIRHASFHEVLYLDADSYPIRDPEFLFHEPDYLRHGAVFWPDLETSSSLLPPDRPAVFGAPPLADLPCESGQLLIDKRRCWRELQLALFLNAHADYTYRWLWGDKDTFPIAWRRLGREYARLWPRAAKTPQAVLQFDSHGKAIFQHRANDKFRLPGVQFASNHQAHAVNQRNPELAHEDYCFRVLDELRDLIVDPPISLASARQTPLVTAAGRAPDVEPITQAYPPVAVDLLVSPEWQRRFAEYFLESREFSADPFEFDICIARSQRRCISVSLFRRHPDNRVPDEFPVDETAWRTKYWEGLCALTRDLAAWPDWKLRIYVERSLAELVSLEFGEHPQVEVYRMRTDSVGASPGTLWRFLALADRSLELTLVTDIDESLADKTEGVRAFELDRRSAVGRRGSFDMDSRYLVASDRSIVKNYPVLLASQVLSRPGMVDFDMAAALRGFMAFRRHAAGTARPWAYSDDERLGAYNEAVDAHRFGWGSHWYMYCFDERFLKHVVYYHFANKGELLTWSRTLTPTHLNPEGVWDLEYARARGNAAVDAANVSELSALNLSPEATRTAYLVAEHRWIFDGLLKLMRRYSSTGSCGCVFFHEISRPYALELVPKQLNLVQAARSARHVLEIGFNAGHSAALMLLANPSLKLRAFDTCGLEYTRPCFEYLQSIFGPRLTLVEGASESSVPADRRADYDLVHVDGDHRYEAVAADLTNSLAKCRHDAIVILDDHEIDSDVARASACRSDLLLTREFELHPTIPGSSQAIFRYRPLRTAPHGAPRD